MQFDSPKLYDLACDWGSLRRVQANDLQVAHRGNFKWICDSKTPTDTAELFFDKPDPLELCLTAATLTISIDSQPVEALNLEGDDAITALTTRLLIFTGYDAIDLPNLSTPIQWCNAIRRPMYPEIPRLRFSAPGPMISAQASRAILQSTKNRVRLGYTKSWETYKTHLSLYHALRGLMLPLLACSTPILDDPTYWIVHQGPDMKLTDWRALASDDPSLIQYLIKWFDHLNNSLIKTHYTLRRLTTDHVWIIEQRRNRQVLKHQIKQDMERQIEHVSSIYSIKHYKTGLRDIKSWYTAQREQGKGWECKAEYNAKYEALTKQHQSLINEYDRHSILKKQIQADRESDIRKARTSDEIKTIETETRIRLNALEVETLQRISRQKEQAITAARNEAYRRTAVLPRTYTCYLSPEVEIVPSDKHVPLTLDTQTWQIV